MLNLKDIGYLGKTVSVDNASDKSKIGLKGKVIFETKNVIVILDKNNNEKKIKKKEILKLNEIMWCSWLRKKKLAFKKVERK